LWRRQPVDGCLCRSRALFFAVRDGLGCEDLRHAPLLRIITGSARFPQRCRDPFSLHVGFGLNVLKALLFTQATSVFPLPLFPLICERTLAPRASRVEDSFLWMVIRRAPGFAVARLYSLIEVDDARRPPTHLDRESVFVKIAVLVDACVFLSSRPHFPPVSDAFSSMFFPSFCPPVFR